MRNPDPPDDEPSASEAMNRGDFARIAGVVLLLGAGFMLTFTPRQTFQAWHRDGYVATEAERLAQPSSLRRRVLVRIAADGAKLDIRNPAYALTSAPSPLRVWYNPAARVDIRFRVLDHPWRIKTLDNRVLPITSYPSVPGAAQAVSALALNLLLGVVGAILLRSPGARARRSR